MMPPFDTAAERLGLGLGALQGAEIALEADWRRLLEIGRAQLEGKDLSAARVTCEMLGRTATEILAVAQSPAGITLAPMTIAVAALYKVRLATLQQGGAAAEEELALTVACLLDIVEDPELHVALRINCLRHAKKLIRDHFTPALLKSKRMSRIDEQLQRAEEMVAKLSRSQPPGDWHPAGRRVN